MTRTGARVGAAIERLPVAWRPAATIAVPQAMRAWGVALIVATVGAVLAGWSRSATVGLLFELYGIPLTVVIASRGVVANIRTSPKWELVMQRPVDGKTFVWQLYAITIAAALIGSAVCAVPVFAAHFSALPGTALLEFSAVWSFEIGVALVAVSTVAASNDGELTLAWAVLPVVVRLLAQQAAAAKPVVDVLLFLLPPVDGAFGFLQIQLGARATMDTQYWVQLLTFPLLCTGIVFLGAARLKMSTRRV